MKKKINKKNLKYLHIANLKSNRIGRNTYRQCFGPGSESALYPHSIASGSGSRNIPPKQFGKTKPKDR
jgi:hypothetical protein